MAFVVVVVREGGGGEWEQGCSVYRVVRGVAAAGRWAVLELIGVDAAAAPQFLRAYRK